MPTDRLQIVLELVTGAYKREAKEAATATSQIGKSADSVTSSLGKMVGPAAIGAALAGLGRLAVKAGENADRLFDLSSQTGLTTDELQEFEYVAKTAGASTEVFSDAVKAIIKNLDGTEGATGAAAKAYEALGISVKTSSGNLRSAGDITEEVFSKLAGMEDVTARNALAQDIFGKKWEETISVLDLGSDAIAKLRGEAHEMGAVVSTEALVGADRLRESLAKLQAQAGGKLVNALGLAATSIASLFGDEASTDALRYSEAIKAVVAQIDEGVQPEAAFANGLFHIAEAGELSREELDNLASAAGFALGELDADTLRAFGEEMYAQAIAAGVSAEAAGEVRTQFSAMAIEMDIANGVIVDQHDSWRNLYPAVKSAADIYAEAAAAADKVRLAEIELANARIANLSPALDALRAIEDSVEAHEALIAAQEEGILSQSEMTQLQFEAAIAAETAKVKIAEFGAVGQESMAEFAESAGIANHEAATLYAQLGLLDGFTARTYVVREFIDKGGRLRGNELGDVFGNENPYKAFGGPVRRGNPYIVGERGPELFIPEHSGSIMSNANMVRMGSGGWGGAAGGTSRTVNINVSSPTNNLSQDLQYASILASVVNYVETS